MSKKSKILFVLEVIFLGVVFKYTLFDFTVLKSSFSVAGGNFNLTWGEGASNAYITTSIIGYIFAILFNLSIGAKAKKSSYILSGLGIIAWVFEASKMFLFMPLIIVFRPDLIILIIDGWNVYKMRKVDKSK